MGHSMYIDDKLKELKKTVQEGVALAKMLREEQRYRFVPDTPSEIYLHDFYLFDKLIDNLLELNNLTRYITISVPQAVPLIRISRLICRMQRRYFAGNKVPVTTMDSLMENLECQEWWRTLPHCEDDFYTRAALLHYFAELRKYYHNLNKLTPLFPDSPASPAHNGFMAALKKRHGWNKNDKS